ncbi:MAG: LacI family DNA-binding transcriptional regulator [Dehalobacterium sp.]|jgi:LacI family transcriptional regulator
MAYTIKDVAKKAGVSKTTISRVLNSPDLVKQETKDKVLNAIQELGYRPNEIARSMVLKKSGILGLVIPDVLNPFFGETAKIIIDEAKERGYSVIVCNTSNNRDIEKEWVDFLLNKRVDGILFASVQLTDPFVEEIVRMGFPCVMYNRRLRTKECDFVISNNKVGAQKAVEHLINLGHQTIGYIGGPARFSTHRDRLEGYKKALKKNGLEINKELICCGELDINFANEATKNLLQLSNPPTAIFADNDIMALESIEAILQSNLRVPEDIALVGYDDIHIASHQLIALTTVAQNKYDMSIIALEHLINKIEKDKELTADKPLNVTLEPKLLIRRTCGFYKSGKGCESKEEGVSKIFQKDNK